MTTLLEREAKPSVAVQLAAVCDDKQVYVAGSGNPIKPGEYFVRIYGLSKMGVTGLSHLLTDEELASIGLTIKRFQGQGIVWDRNSTRYYTLQALAVSVWRLLKPNVNKYPTVTYL